MKASALSLLSYVLRFEILCMKIEGEVKLSGVFSDAIDPIVGKAIHNPQVEYTIMKDIVVNSTDPAKQIVEDNLTAFSKLNSNQLC